MSIRICIVGGIFDKPEEYRSKHAISPETVLVDGLRAAGLTVSARGHASFRLDPRASIVHVHHFGRAALKMAALNRRAKFVLTRHDPLLLNGLPMNWKRRVFDSLVVRRADALIALSDTERGFLTQRFGVADRRITVIPNGVNEQVFGDNVNNRDNDKDSLLFVGQLQLFKGLDYLLRALPAIRNARPKVTLTLAYHTDALLERYRALARDLGVAECVVFAGPKSPSELAALYANATVVVVPSLGECLCTVITEAMCAGAAIVATDVGGVRTQLVGHGVIVPPADSDALALSITQLLADSARRHESGHVARERWRTTFQVDRMIASHIELYEKLLSGELSERGSIAC